MMLTRFESCSFGFSGSGESACRWAGKGDRLARVSISGLKWCLAVGGISLVFIDSQHEAMMKSKNALLGLGLALLGIEAGAHDLSVSSAWSLSPPPSSSNGAVYLVVENSGPKADMLMGAEADVARKIELHATSHEDGQMKMHHHHSFEVPADGSLELAPGALHIMLMGLVEPLEAGQSFDLKLMFMHAGEMSVEVEVLESPPSG
ncbi:MAG: copper chaperone PCu(A)C [Gammaproteobacteria bacterium]|nr:copper chaperone PCu(A)C [Gammaproteobacteria bacterium]